MAATTGLYLDYLLVVVEENKLGRKEAKFIKNMSSWKWTYRLVLVDRQWH